MTTDKQTLPQQFHWGSKAETLQSVMPLLAEAQVPDLYFFNIKEWLAMSKDVSHYWVKIGKNFNKLSGRTRNLPTIGYTAIYQLTTLTDDN